MLLLGAGSGLLNGQKAVSVSHFDGPVAQPVSFPRGTSGVPAVFEGNLCVWSFQDPVMCGTWCSHSLSLNCRVQTTSPFLCFTSLLKTGPGVPVVSVHRTNNTASEYAL